ncbi:MAG: efflux RND transporter periplasmic adaptor subunit [Desulfobacterales bacterium]|nr:MAG: efflux RND transporter periplasmic adaptor subunit [Desulfobacterales bacterium]
MYSHFGKSIPILLGIFIYTFVFSSSLWSQDKPKGPPPANVTVAEVKNGMVAPQAEFVGTVYYQEVSDVASELSGLVETVSFEEGQRVKKGQILVQLGSEILGKDLQATKSSYEQVLAELEIARIDLTRKEKLFKRKSIAEQTYDEERFQVIGLEKRAASLKAQVERIEIELGKKVIRAPYEAVVLERRVDRGEWIAQGASVAVLAKDDVVDIVVEVPERFIPYVRQGMPAQAAINGYTVNGKIVAIVPRGDIATRTFPVKIRTPNKFSLIEGMSARVILPTGERKNTLIVPRDAVISMSGRSVVFVVNDSKAGMRPVKMVGYEGLNAAIEASDLNEGMLVALKGNERLRDGQMVLVK